MSPRRAVLFDIDGVLTVSWQVLPGAAEAVEALRQSGFHVSFLTNTTSLSSQAIAERLRSAGIAVEPAEIFTAGKAAAHYVATHYPAARCLLLNSGSLGNDLAGIDVVPPGSGGADLVLTGGAGPEITYELLNEAFRLLLDGAPFVAMQRGSYWKTSEGPQLDMGAFVTGLEHAANAQATVVGKPAPELFLAALDALGTGAAEATMVGDDVVSDVLGAQALGIEGVLVRTGKYRSEALEKADGRPDHVIDSVADLPGLLATAT